MDHDQRERELLATLCLKPCKIDLRGEEVTFRCLRRRGHEQECREAAVVYPPRLVEEDA